MADARPILFSTPMVLALLAGTKTQTRRIVKPQPHHGPVGQMVNLGGCDWAMDDGDLSGLWRCRYGKPADLLYVRETWQVVRSTLDWETGGEHDVFSWDAEVYGDPKDYLSGDPRGGIAAKVYYAADGEDDNPGVFYDVIGFEGRVLREREISWRPSIHMPRWASRLTLEVTDVRIERLQDISEADAIAEGAEPCSNGWWFDRSPQLAGSDARGAYYCLWNKINGANSWSANPWVWAVSFKVHQANVDAFIAARTQ